MSPGGGRKRRWSTTPNIVAVAPIPSPSVATTAAANPGLRRSPRAAYVTTLQRVSQLMRLLARAWHRPMLRPVGGGPPKSARPAAAGAGPKCLAVVPFRLASCEERGAAGGDG